ncbi:MAG: hypothetical protein HYU66_07365 [Armatimonadetes bacterium]|nr:hypothetical protein [Armatimonadota bacterium]
MQCSAPGVMTRRTRLYLDGVGFGVCRGRVDMETDGHERRVGQTVYYSQLDSTHHYGYEVNLGGF